MNLAGGEAEPHRQPVGVNNGVNFAGQSASRTAHVLFSIACYAGPMLVHAHDGRIDHLYSCILNGR
jgi:hypothetical protein